MLCQIYNCIDEDAALMHFGTVMGIRTLLASSLDQPKSVGSTCGGLDVRMTSKCMFADGHV